MVSKAEQSEAMRIAAHEAMGKLPKGSTKKYVAKVNAGAGKMAPAKSGGMKGGSAKSGGGMKGSKGCK